MCLGGGNTMLEAAATGANAIVTKNILLHSKKCLCGGRRCLDSVYCEGNGELNSDSIECADVDILDVLESLKRSVNRRRVSARSCFDAYAPLDKVFDNILILMRNTLSLRELDISFCKLISPPLLPRSAKEFKYWGLVGSITLAIESCDEISLFKFIGELCLHPLTSCQRIAELLKTTRDITDVVNLNSFNPLENLPETQIKVMGVELFHRWISSFSFLMGEKGAMFLSLSQSLHGMTLPCTEVDRWLNLLRDDNDRPCRHEGTGKDFFDSANIHGSDSCDTSTFSIRFDGVFSEEFLEKTQLNNYITQL
jgi:hypothetical protein